MVKIKYFLEASDRQQMCLTPQHFEKLAAAAGWQLCFAVRHTKEDQTAGTKAIWGELLDQSCLPFDKSRRQIWQGTDVAINKCLPTQPSTTHSRDIKHPPLACLFCLRELYNIINIIFPLAEIKKEKKGKKKFCQTHGTQKLLLTLWRG